MTEGTGRSHTGGWSSADANGAGGSGGWGRTWDEVDVEAGAGAACCAEAPDANCGEEVDAAAEGAFAAGRLLAAAAAPLSAAAALRHSNNTTASVSCAHRGAVIWYERGVKSSGLRLDIK